jgi:hypothetical protein
MPLQKILFKPGVNRENTRYTTEGGWYEGDKIRFRQGNPEKIGGWTRYSVNKFVGVCRALWNWITLASANLVGVGTNLKYYIVQGGEFYDVTPIRRTATLTNPFQAAYSTLSSSITATSTSMTVVSATNFAATSGVVRVGSEDIFYSYIAGNTMYNLVRGYNGTTAASHASTSGVGSYNLTVTDSGNGASINDYVTYSGGGITSLGGNITATVLTNEFQVVLTGSTTYVIKLSTYATAADTGNGGTVIAQYQVNTGYEYQVPLVGWGAGTWGSGTWGVGTSTTGTDIQIWNHYNWGQDLLYGPRGGQLYFWNAGVGTVPVQVTISIASPAVITMPAGFSVLDGNTITFTTTGALPTGLSVGTVYFVVDSTGNTFNLSTTFGGSLVNTSAVGSGAYYISPRGISLVSSGDADAPLFQNYVMVSDTSRFVIVFGTNDYGQAYLDPMLIRWSDQEDPYTWTPSATNQARSLRLSHGSQIITAVQTRQEIAVITDQAVYSLQNVGPPLVWQSQLMGDNISIAGPNAAVLASGVVYWMGVDKFYKYDGRTQTLNCDLRRYVFNNFNQTQNDQVYCSTNEGFNEVWWFYPSANSNTVDKYVIYNYLENTWYYGNMARTAWIDSGLLPYPVAATYNGYLANHEDGVDDNETGTPAPIEAYISSSEFDIDDGHNLGFVWRVLPDLTFAGSSTDPTTNAPPQVTMTLYPLQNSGSGAGKTDTDTVKYGSSYNITEEFTGQVYTRVRGRQLIFEIESTQLGTTWQLGAPRIDIRKDGRR